MVCPDGLVYRKKAAACRPSCQDPNAAKLCHLPDKETCVCPEGLLYHDGSCIRPQDCGCIDENSTRYEVPIYGSYPIMNVVSCDKPLLEHKTSICTVATMIMVSPLEKRTTPYLMSTGMECWLNN